MRLAIYLACALSLSACTEGLNDAQDSFVEPDLSGSLRIPLLAEDAVGESYRIRGATFEISGAVLMSITDRNGVRARESLVTRLPAGEYTVYLRPGWRLMHRSADGTETPAEAKLVSANPLVLRVNELGDESLQLTVRQGEREIRFGGGAQVHVTRVEDPTPAPAL